MQRSTSSAEFLNIVSNFIDSVNSVSEIKAKEKLLLKYLDNLEIFLTNPDLFSGASKNVSKIYQSLFSRMSLITGDETVLSKSLDILNILWKIAQFPPVGIDSVQLFLSSCIYSMRNSNILPKFHTYFKDLFINPDFIHSFLKSDGFSLYLSKVYTIDSNEIIIEQTNKILNLISPEFFTLSEIAPAINIFAQLGKTDKIQPKLRKLASLLLMNLFDKLKQTTNFTIDDFPAFDSEFLMGFIVHLPHENLANIIIENRPFIDMTLDIFRRKKSKIHQSHIVRALLETSPYIKQKNILFMIISDFITAVPAERTVEPILNYMSDFKTTQFCDVFLSCFVKTVEIAEAFVKCDGIEWLEDMRVKGIVDMELYSQMLSSLVVLRRFDDLDDFIDDLDQKHPLFSLGKQQLDKIVYGMKTSRYRPIRVPSLFTLLDKPSFIDPYNAWMLGNCVVSQYLKKGYDIFDIPFIIDIGNRYIKTKHVNLLMQRPFELKKFCNQKHMHYPLFQFYQGREEFKINDNFSAISFWFCVSDEQDNIINIFHTDYILISIEKNKLILTLNDEKYFFDIDCRKMTFVYISLQEKFLGSIVHFFLRSSLQNEMIEIRVPARTKNPFSFAGFGWIGRGLMFLGCSIRIYKNRYVPADILYSHGPEFIDYIDNTRMEIIITPYTFCNPSSNEPNSSTDPRIVLPPNFVAVPYFGLPFHFLSMRKISGLFKFLGTATTSEQYNNLFSTLMRITQITYFNSLKFWPKILSSMKKHREFINKSMFLKALKTASYHSRRERILASILFDDEMWEFVDNEILIAGLFDYFSDIDWTSIEGIEHFLATKVIKNPTNLNIVEMILKNHEKIPNLIQNLICIMKTSHVLDDKEITWNGITTTKRTDVQLTIIQGFINFINEKNIEYFTKICDFESLKFVMLNSSEEACILMYHLIVTCNIFSPGFLRLDQTFLVLIAKFAFSCQIWTDTFLLATDNITESESLRTALTILLALVWSVSLVLVHLHSFHNSKTNIEDFQEILLSYKNGISILKDHIQVLYSQDLCISLFVSWFPLIFTYTGHLQTFSENYDKSSTNRSNMSDNFDIKPVAKDLSESIPPMQPPQKAYSFILTVIQDVLGGFGLTFPVLEEDFDSNGFVKYISEEFPLNLFLSSIIYKCPARLFLSLFSSFYLNIPFYEIGRSNLIIQPLMHIFLRNCSEITSNFHMSLFLDFILFFVTTKGFSDRPVEFFEDFFGFLYLTTLKYKFNFISHKINFILFDMFMHSPHKKMEDILNLFVQNITTIIPFIIQSKSSKAWYYLFFTVSKTSSKSFDQLIEKFTSLLPNDQKELTFLDSIYETDIDQSYFQYLEKEFHQQMENEEKYVKQNNEQILQFKSSFYSVVSSLSKSINSQSYFAHQSHFFNAINFKKNLLTLEKTFVLNEEMTKWKLFIQSQKDKLSIVQNYDPICFHLSPRCFPFSCPRILTPSTLQPIVNGHITSFPFTFVNNHLYTKNSQSNLLELFKRVYAKYGNPISFAKCELIRYENRIKSVMFIYKAMILILTFAELNDDNYLRLIEPNNEFLVHSFIESVLIGHWGQTTLFNSHIVICLSLSTLICARRYEADSIQVWTFKSGHFILKSDDKNIIYLFSRLCYENFTTPSNSFVFNIRKSEEIYLNYANGRLSTEQMLLALNCFNQRSFVDLNNAPYFPALQSLKILDRKVPDKKVTLSYLHHILPFSYYETESVNKSDYYIPSLLFYVPDVNFGFVPACDMRHDLEDAIGVNEYVLHNYFPQNVRDDLQKVTERVKRNVISVAFINQIHVCQSINRRCAEHQTLLFERNTVRKINKLSARIEATHPYYIRIDKRLLSMTLLNKETGQVFYSKMDYLMIFADAVSIAANGLFIVVDFEFGLTRVYQINFKQSVPSDFSLVSELSWDLVPQSVISGIDFICATAAGERLVLWEFTYGTVHRYKDFDEKIQQLSMDEKYGSVWIATDSKLMAFSLNMEQLAELQIKNITCLEVVPHPSDCTERTAILGFEDGKVAICLLRFDIKTFEVKYLPSEHEYPVDRITTHPSLEEFLSIDEEGNALLWNAFGVNGATQKLSIYDSCPYCGDKVAAYCTLCNRTVCAKCMSESNPKTLCAMCAALHAYL